MSDDEDWSPNIDEYSTDDSNAVDDPSLCPRPGFNEETSAPGGQSAQSPVAGQEDHESVPGPSTSATVMESSSSASTQLNIQLEIGATQARGRKRPKNETQWTRNKRKLCRNSGQPYVTAKNVAIPSKIFQRNLNCDCPKKCPSLFKSEDDVERFFESFWKLADFSKQNVFLRGIVQASKIHRSRPRDGSAPTKTRTYQYFIPVKDETIRVCKKYFLRVLQISWGRLFRCLSKEEVFGVIDSRGKGPSNKIDDTDVIAHIKSFPSYQSHYSRKDNINKKYLNPELNIKKMYNLYVEKCAHENKQPVKEKYYYHVFSTKFNLHFKVPSKDTCKVCDEILQKMKIENDMEAKRALQLEKELHLRKAEQAREALKEDKESASENKYVCTFDLQKALPFPKLSTSVAYYKRNLYVYNFGIHSFNDSTGYMYVWDETEGGRGSEDLASCIRKHVMKYASQYKHIVFYSDSCTGQNRNIKMALTLLKLVQEPELQVEKIELKFLVSGHSFLPNDTEFGVIERGSKKHQFIYNPEGWFKIIQSAKKKQPHFKVVHMERREFLSTASLEKSITNRKKDKDKEPLNWLKFRWLKFKRGSPFEIQFKENLNEMSVFRTIYLKKNKTDAGRPVQCLTSVAQTCLYPTRRPMQDAKKKDMMSLLPFIPPIYYEYYRNLPGAVATRSSASHEDEENDEIEYL